MSQNIKLKGTKKRKYLTPKERNFVEEYLLDFNQTQAVIRAGYQVKNSNVAHVISQRLLQKDTVKKYLEEKQKEIAERNKITKDYFIIHLRRIIEDPETKAGDKINALSVLARITGYWYEKETEQKPVVIIQQLDSKEAISKYVTDRRN